MEKMLCVSSSKVQIKLSYCLVNFPPNKIVFSYFVLDVEKRLKLNLMLNQMEEESLPQKPPPGQKNVYIPPGNNLFAVF